MIKYIHHLPLVRVCHTVAKSYTKHLLKPLNVQACKPNASNMVYLKYLSTSDDSIRNSKEKLHKTVQAPINLCCMQSCVNCVWLEYVDVLLQDYKKKGALLDIQEVLKEIDKDIEDPSVRAYIKFEINSKLK